MSYVIYFKGRDGHDAHYWTGGFRANGDPTWGEDWRVGRR